jgi:hypothetical protein
MPGCAEALPNIPSLKDLRVAPMLGDFSAHGVLDMALSIPPRITSLHLHSYYYHFDAETLDGLSRLTALSSLTVSATTAKSLSFLSLVTDIRSLAFDHVNPSFPAPDLPYDIEPLLALKGLNSLSVVRSTSLTKDGNLHPLSHLLA